MSISIDAVAEFEDWFFDVRDKFEATSWIAHEAIQRRPGGELLAADIGPFWRWIGFRFGPPILEPILAAANAITLRQQGIESRGFVLPLTAEFVKCFDSAWHSVDK